MASRIRFESCPAPAEIGLLFAPRADNKWELAKVWLRQEESILMSVLADLAALLKGHREGER